MTIRFDTVVYRFNGKRIDKATFERLRAVGGMIQETKESKSGLLKRRLCFIMVIRINVSNTCINLIFSEIKH